MVCTHHLFEILLYVSHKTNINIVGIVKGITRNEIFLDYALN